MKKMRIFCAVFLTVVFSSCSSDSEDSPDETASCGENSALVNTTWKGDGDRSLETITFSSATNYSWSSETWGTRNGEFCFDGINGNFDDGIRFTISGNVMTLNSEDQWGTGKFHKQ